MIRTLIMDICVRFSSRANHKMRQRRLRFDAHKNSIRQPNDLSLATTNKSHLDGINRKETTRSECNGRTTGFLAVLSSRRFLQDLESIINNENGIAVQRRSVAARRSACRRTCWRCRARTACWSDSHSATRPARIRQSLCQPKRRRWHGPVGAPVRRHRESPNHSEHFRRHNCVPEG